MALFVPYLTTRDYSATIQSGQFYDQVLGELENQGSTERTFAENWAMSQIRAKIGDQYDLDSEFTATLPYSNEKVYRPGQRCTIDFPEWKETISYYSGSLVELNGFGYICLVDPASSEWDDSQWQNIGNSGDIYYIPFPAPLFSFEIKQQRGSTIAGYYRRGDRVFWNGKIYENLIETSPVSQRSSINYNTYSALPKPNVFPNDTLNKGYWKEIEEVFYEGEPPMLPTPGGEPPIWVLGDNRDPIIVSAIMDLALFKLHDRIAPNNIPQLRIEAMRRTFEDLKSIASGTETTEVQQIQPRQGSSFAGGSQPKKVNGWR